ARVLYQSLLIGKEMILRGERDARRIQSQLEAYIKKEPLARIDYVSISNSQTLQEVQKIEGKTLIALAVWIGKTRLIDNIIVRQP
ncbi:MAG: pantoate--beta-alanine ligase, partial [Nitrospiria bacterium]